MENFNFFNPTEIIFGKDRENEVGDAVLKYGKKVLFMAAAPLKNPAFMIG